VSIPSSDRDVCSGANVKGEGRNRWMLFVDDVVLFIRILACHCCCSFGSLIR